PSISASTAAHFGPRFPARKSSLSLLRLSTDAITLASIFLSATPLIHSISASLRGIFCFLLLSGAKGCQDFHFEFQHNCLKLGPSQTPVYWVVAVDDQGRIFCQPTLNSPQFGQGKLARFGKGFGPRILM